jgi:dsDNA-binding SOS-regulon protein
MKMTHVVTYLTVNGNYEIVFTNKQEADEYAKRLKGLKAAGVRVKELV